MEVVDLEMLPLYENELQNLKEVFEPELKPAQEIVLNPEPE